MSIAPHYQGHGVTLYHADCLDVLRDMPDNSVDSVVTDPPYGLEFMGKEWDAPWKTGNGFRRADNAADVGRDSVFGRASARGPEYRAGIGFQQWCLLWAVECLRVLKPGGHLLAFGGTRTWHRLACAVEDAGFEVRDSIAWLYGSGFPKSLDVSKAIDRAAGAEREVVGDKLDRPGYHLHGHDSGTGALGRGISSTTAETRLAAAQITAPATDAARQWSGWGTALKPAFEPVVVARKPLTGTVAANVLAWGTGALNVDGCRIETSDGYAENAVTQGVNTARTSYDWRPERMTFAPHTAGRWPANVILDEDQAAALDEQSGESSSKRSPRGAGKGETSTYGSWGMADDDTRGHDDTGGASRFFPTFRYEAKAPTDERPRIDGVSHATVKPLELMRWLVRLVTPPGGTVLEPFAGSGTTAEACILEGFQCVAIEKGAEHLPLIMQRINRQRDPVEAIRQRGEDLGLFEGIS